MSDSWYDFSDIATDWLEELMAEGNGPFPANDPRALRLALLSAVANKSFALKVNLDRALGRRTARRALARLTGR